MPPRHRLPILFLFCSPLRLTLADSSLQCDSSENDQCAQQQQPVCRLYLARSSVPNSGLGLFSGVPHEVGSSIAPPEIAHQLLSDFDGELHVGSEYGESLVRQYTWSSYVSGGSFEAAHVESLIPGVGMAANSFLPLVNARSVMGSIDSAGTGNGPGAGAFSAYHDTTYVAESPLEVGSEIFADYGDAYFRGRPDQYGMIPLEEEFLEADEIMTKLWAALPPAVKNTDKDDPIGTDWQPFWDAIRDLVVDDERTFNALPSSVSEIKRAATKGTPYNFLRGDNPRTLDWLQSNGLCIDTLDVRQSKIPQAGRGVFAKRPFAAGETILPLPLIQISREALNIFKRSPTDVDSEGSQVYSQQQILNYCYGHKDSSVLLFPYSPTSSFVNHDGKDANAKLVWANEDTDVAGFHRDDWMEKRPEELLQEGHTGLMMMLVATRAVATGDEVTIDYGSEWQNAWEDHVVGWSMRHDPSATQSLTASELNESEDRIQTVFEDSYESVSTACHYLYVPDEEEEEEEEAEEVEEEEQSEMYVDPDSEVDGDEALGLVYDEEALDKLGANLPLIEDRAAVWKDHGGRHTISGDNLRPCKVVAMKEDASSNETLYTVRVFNCRDGSPHVHQIPTNIEHYVKDVPRRAILFVDLPYTSSHQKERVFRHEIGLPDGDEDLWPQIWKDILE